MRPSGASGKSPLKQQLICTLNCTPEFRLLAFGFYGISKCIMTQIFKIGRPFPRSAIGFQPEYLDFQKGIRVGNLDDNQRITRILKLALEARYKEPFVTERFGRGVYWQWIGFLPRANRSAKPISSNVSFGCSKFYLTMDTDERIFKCGFSVERGMVQPPPDYPKIELKPDFDWHRLLAALRPSGAMQRELKRLVNSEGFQIDAGGWKAQPPFTKSNFPSMAKLKKILEGAPGESWAGFQVYYAMREKEVGGSTGIDLVESMMAIFEEVTPAMNLCMQVQIGS
jgi:hypothetical protein